VDIKVFIIKMWQPPSVWLYEYKYKQSNTQHTFFTLSATCFGYLTLAIIWQQRIIKSKLFTFLCKQFPFHDSVLSDDDYLDVAEACGWDAWNIYVVYLIFVFIYRKVFIFYGHTISEYVSFRAKFKYITNYKVFLVKIINHAQIYI